MTGEIVDLDRDVQPRTVSLAFTSRHYPRALVPGATANWRGDRYRVVAVRLELRANAPYVTHVELEWCGKL